ncbi:hypothetical protein RD110_07930 [Rhodoferax koreense]|uniref:Uncharacterized protein n=1 Tax=Rhodoferax koreensis TaxID=1842727 RepID=A0A1P8JTQ6_9BURK|nr:hypothetical protein [Rhodoferax koreense]APW37132.1 hypothetical protein RD110_07930 [Rhodoferax koreense]
MNAPIEGRTIRGIDLNNDAYRARWKDLPGNVQAEGKKAIQSMLFMELDAPPAKLHLHTLKNREVQSRLDPTKKVAVWTIHLTADDNYKASFTLEHGTAYFRTCGKHDAVDKKP